MMLLFVACTSRTMVGISNPNLEAITENPEIQVSTQHFFMLPAGPSFKGKWSEDHKMISTGVGVGVISFLPQRSRWFMNPPTVGFSLLEWHDIGGETYWGTLSPFVQLTAPPLCVSPNGCFFAISPFIEYEYSNIIGTENQHNYTIGLYWSTTN